MPASCDNHQRSVTKDACRIADLEVALGCALSVLTKSITMRGVVSGYGQRHSTCSSPYWQSHVHVLLMPQRGTQRQARHGRGEARNMP